MYGQLCFALKINFIHMLFVFSAFTSTCLPPAQAPLSQQKFRESLMLV